MNFSNPDRAKIRDRVIFRLAGQVNIQGVRALVPDEERVSIRRSELRGNCSHHAARTGAVLDDHRLTHALGQLATDQPRENVGCAGRERDYHRDGLRRIALGERSRCGEREEQRAEQDDEPVFKAPHEPSREFIR